MKYLKISLKEAKEYASGDIDAYYRLTDKIINFVKENDK